MCSTILLMSSTSESTVRGPAPLWRRWRRGSDASRRAASVAAVHDVPVLEWQPYDASGSSATPYLTRLTKPAPYQATSSFCPTPTGFPDSQRLNAVLACHGYLTDGKVLPAALLMAWHQYDFRWRARVPWGAVARKVV